MKKFSLIAILVVAMLFSLTGCGKTDYEMYSDAYKNAEEMKGIDAEGSLKLVINSVDGTTNMNLPIDFALKVDDVNNKNAKMLITYSMPIMGMNTQSSVYVADGYRYTATKTSIEGEVEYTRQYIFENSYITITRFTKYKNCSYTDLNSEYKYSVQQESGETITFKNKGTVSKVYTEDFTYVE